MSYFEAGGALLVFCEVEVSQLVSKAMTAAGLFLHHPYYYASMKQRKIETFEQVCVPPSVIVMYKKITWCVPVVFELVSSIVSGWLYF